MNAGFRDELIDILVRESYVERQVTLSSGKVSDYYLDCRPAMFLPRASFLAGELMLQLAVEAGVAQIGGMAVAAIPVISSIISAAYRHDVALRGCFVRKDCKSASKGRSARDSRPPSSTMRSRPAARPSRRSPPFARPGPT